MNMVTVLLTSAGTSAVVTGGITLFGQMLERRARQEDMMFQYAIELTKTRSERFLQHVKDIKSPRWQLKDDIVTAEQYYEWLKHLRKYGKLPNDDNIKRVEDWFEYPVPEEKS